VVDEHLPRLGPGDIGAGIHPARRRAAEPPEGGAKHLTVAANLPVDADLASAGPLLRVDDVHVRFTPARGETVYAVNGVDLEIGRGEIHGLVGETGSGKSVTTHAILGLVQPPGVVTGGPIRLGELNLRTLKPAELRRVLGSRLSYVPQNPRTALNPLLRVGQQMRNVIESHQDRGRRRKGPGADIENRCLDMIAAVGISDPQRVLRSYPHELSGGMAQRVVIAIALLLGPELVIADEPTTGLDVTVQMQILELFTSAVRERGAAVLLVTHDLGVVAHYCQRVAIMYAGRVVERGRVGDVFRTPQHPYTVGLLRSVPVIGKQLTFMAGQTPHLHAPPHACTFAPRCGHATEECRTRQPPWQQLSTGHEAFCHWPEKVRHDNVALPR
jgi:oligopeptide/dipeptide ABC transporter ATP-binding protein